MTLQRRLILAISLLLILLLTANLVVTVHNARLNIYQQLEVHAQDTATSLGFSISQAAQAKDTVQVRSMIDVIFDRGYYRKIIYRDLEGQEIVKRESSLASSGVPLWFSRWLPVPEPSGSAVVSSGWFQLGEIEVVSHPGFAYQDLWRSFKEQLWLFLFTIVLCYGLLGLALKLILKPLKQVERQAEAICRREFIVQDSLPSIPELRSVVNAMNRMVEKVKTMFGYQVELNDRLHQQLRTDDITGLANRRDFDERLLAYLKSERTTDEGALLLMQIGDLLEINRTKGREDGDDYLQTIAQYLVNLLKNYPDHLCSRHSGSDFALFVPAINEQESRELMEKIYTDLQTMEWSGERIQPIYLGVVYASDVTQLDNETTLLALADRALNEVRMEEQSGYHWRAVDASANRSVVTNQQWSELIQSALKEKSFHFRYQPVWLMEEKAGDKQASQRVLFNEALTHLAYENIDYSASVIIPIATRLQLMPQFDAQVIKSVIESQVDLQKPLCINVSTAAIEDKDFIADFNTQLVAHKALAAKLIFELPANSLSFSEEAVRHFAEVIKSAGAKLSLHHFGRGTAEFAFLQSLPLDYLKIDRCFIQNITDDLDSQFFVRSLVTIAKSCDVMVLAEGVETESQWSTLLKLGIQGGQGFWLGKPQASPKIN
jgi:diguanylate cyclase (GGDEF)-like protein